MKLGVRPEEIELLINTHCHFDHAGGDLDFCESSGCRVLIHSSEARILREGDSAISCAVIFGERLKPVEKAEEVREGDEIDLGSLTLTVLHTPGHTAGSICLYDREHQLLFSGDTVFSDGVGRTDLPTGDERLLVESLKRLNQLKVKKLYPGHGAPNEHDPEVSLKNALRFFDI